ncbi:hypothetical protein MRX96_020879 [Rhipicephalus microplus]
MDTKDNGTNVPEVFTEHRLNPVYATIDGPLRRAAASVLAWPSRHLVYAGRSLLSGTSSKQANYGHLLGARPTDLAFELRNMLPASLSQAPYDTLKTILERTAMCERRCSLLHAMSSPSTLSAAANPDNAPFSCMTLQHRSSQHRKIAPALTLSPYSWNFLQRHPQ